MNLSTPLFVRTAVSQTEKAYSALEEMIVTGELPPGSQWSETVSYTHLRAQET